MYLKFNQLPDTSRIWIYQSSRDFTQEEAGEIGQVLEKFLSGWQAHGADLQASYKIAYHRFIIIGANQDFHAPSGCSIDLSVAIIRQLEQHYGVRLFERTQIPFKSAEGQIKTVPMQKIKEMIATGEITLESTTFNNLVETVGQFNTEWEVPAKESWLKRYFGVAS